MSKKNKSTPVAVMDPDEGVQLHGSGSEGAVPGRVKSFHGAAEEFEETANGREWDGRLTGAKARENSLSGSESRLRKQSEALANLTHARAHHRGDLRAVLRGITEAAARALEVERASVWLFNQDASQVRCFELYERRLDFHSEGVELTVRNYPAYFQALERDFIIAAHHARTDLRTREFTDDYLGPLGITSMLDASIRLGEKLVGVVCHEHIGPPRRWTADEQNFAGSIADLTSLALEDMELKRTEAALRESETRFSSFMNNTSALAWMKDGGFRYVYVNQPFERFFGCSAIA